jgi:hypothetical protein
MSSYQLYQLPAAVLFSGGVLAPGWYVEFYATGTTTPVDVYTTSALNVAHDWPVEAGADGVLPVIYLNSQVVYKTLVYDQNDVLQPGYGADPVNDSVLSQAIIGALLYPRTSVEIAAGVTPSNYAYPEGHAWRYLSAVQLADVKAFTFGENVTTALQQAMDVAWESGEPCIVPRGGYLVTTLDLPGAQANRERSFRLLGSGIGEIFDRTMAGATIFKGDGSDAPILRYVQDAPNTGNGSADIGWIRFEANSATAYAVDFGSFYAQSAMHDFCIYQAGNGGGLNCELVNTSTFRNGYVLNDDWATNGLGLSRTGIGLNFQNTIDATGPFLMRITSRGFLTAFQIGGGAGKNITPHILECECSVTTNGVKIGATTEKAVVDTCYFEGGDGGTGIEDLGSYSTIRDNLLYTGYAIVIDASADTYGTVVSGNKIGSAAVEDAVLIKVRSTGAYGGPGKTVENNSLSYTAGTDGVKGIQVTGVDPRISLSGNVFDPRGAWTGTGTEKIDDQSTHSDATGSSAGSSGMYGLVVADAGSYEFPMLSQGAISLGLDPTAVTESAVASNVLTLSKASDFVLTCGTAQTINSFSSPNLEGKLFWIRTTNANATFANTSSLKMAGAANYTPGAGGAMLCFKVHAGVAWETSRVAY